MTDKKILADRFAACLSDLRIEDIFDLLHEDCAWWMVGRADRFPMGGKRGRAEIEAFLPQVFERFDSFEFVVDRTTEQDDRIVVEAHAVGIGPGPARYENVYAAIFRVQDGKFIEIREFYDPLEAFAYQESIPAQPA